MSINRTIMIGRLVRDPDRRYTASGLSVTTFQIAVDRPFKDSATGQTKTDFFRCKVWRKRGDFVAENVTKGTLVCVEGRLENSEHTGNDGIKRYYTDLVADNVEILDKPRGTTASQGDAPAPDGDEFSEFPDDDFDGT